MVGTGEKDFYMDNEAQSQRYILTLKYPIELPLSPVGMIWRRSGTTLSAWTACGLWKTLVLLTKAFINSDVNREEMSQIRFEAFNTPSYLPGCGHSHSAVLVLIWAYPQCCYGLWLWGHMYSAHLQGGL